MGQAELIRLAGQDLGLSDWHEVTQDQVNLFADATGDHQWVHVDEGRARSGPFGGTISHSFLTLALSATLMGEIFRIQGFRMGLNYGLNRVRFPSPVPVGSRIRSSARVESAEPIVGGVQSVIGLTVHVEGQDKPACVAEVVVRFYA